VIRSRRWRLWLPGLLATGACAAAAVFAIGEWMESESPIVLKTPLIQQAASASPEERPLAAIPVDPAQEAVVIDRPLFSPTRHKPVPKPPPPQPASNQPAAAAVTPPPQVTFALVGIIHEQGAWLAILQPQDGGPAKTLHVGEALQGWQLLAITLDRAMFRNGDFQHELVLDFRHGSAPRP